MPPERWLRELPKPQLTVGGRIRRERLKHGWTQGYLGQLVGLPQGRIAALELSTSAPRKKTILRKLESALELPSNTLIDLAMSQGDDDGLWPEIPENSVAIPNEPELIEAVRALFLYEPEELPNIAGYLRANKRHPETGDEAQKIAG